MDAHLYKFKANMGTYSGEQGERLNRDAWTLDTIIRASKRTI